ncbi:MAG: hypothetical protein AAGI91_04945 [Bacteroidota bacterium]
MATERKAHIVYYDPDAEGESASLAALNDLLGDGWLPLHVAAMGGASTGIDSDLAPRAGYAALVVLERPKDYTVSGFGS